jgi:hypothetical protein
MFILVPPGVIPRQRMSAPEAMVTFGVPLAGGAGAVARGVGGAAVAPVPAERARVPEVWMPSWFREVTRSPEKAIASTKPLVQRTVTRFLWSSVHSHLPATAPLNSTV